MFFFNFSSCFGPFCSFSAILYLMNPFSIKTAVSRGETLSFSSFQFQRIRIQLIFDGFGSRAYKRKKEHRVYHTLKK